MILTHDNITQPIDEWAADYGIPADLITLRIAAGWTTADAIETETPTKAREIKQHRRDLRAEARRHRAPERVLPKRSKPSVQRFIAHDGETLTVRQWSDRLGIPRHTIHSRLKLGLPVARVLTPGDLRATFKGVKPSIFITYQNQTRTLSEWSCVTGIGVATLRHRHRRGASPARILDPRLNVRPEILKPSRKAFYVSALGRRLTLAEWSRRTGIKAATLRQRIVVQGMTGDEAITKPVRPGGRRPNAHRGVGRAQDVNAGTGALPTAQISA